MHQLYNILTTRSCIGRVQCGVGWGGFKCLLFFYCSLNFAGELSLLTLEVLRLKMVIRDAGIVALFIDVEALYGIINIYSGDVWNLEITTNYSNKRTL